MDAVSAYEKLRAGVLDAEPSVDGGLCIIRRRGLAAWIRECGSEPQVAVRTNHQAAPVSTSEVSPGASDLTRLLAGIIVSLAMEPAHARG